MSVIEHGYVYAIGLDGEVKLGVSATDPSRRLKNNANRQLQKP